MLPYRSHWRFAFEQDPTREARLLAFASGPSAPAAPDPLGNNETFAIAGADAEGHQLHPENPVDTVDLAREDARSRVGEILTPPSGEGGGEQKRELLRSAEVFLKLDHLKKDLGKLRELMIEKKKVVAGIIPPESMVEWSKLEDLFGLQLTNINNWLDIAEVFTKFESGEMHPIAFAQWLKRGTDEPGNKDKQYFTARQKLFDAFGTIIADSAGKSTEALRDGQIPDITERAVSAETYTQQLNASDRATIAQNILRDDRIGDLFQGTLTIMNNFVEFVKKLVEESKAEELLKEVEKLEQEEEEQEENKTNHGISGIIHEIDEMLGIQRVSVLQLVEGGKLWWNAYKDAFHESVHHGGALVASHMGKLTKVLPFGQDVDIVLERNLDSSDDEEKEKYLNYLKRLSPEFTELIGVHGHHSIIAENAHNGNRARAVLHYAASRGWLYDIDEPTAESKEHRILGWKLKDLVPKDWNDNRIGNYFTTLREENESGLESEMKKGKAKVQTNENIPFFIKEIDTDLDNGNIWYARGIAERAIERGLISETSPWLAVTFLRHLSENDVLRKYIPQKALDKFGDLAFYKSAFTLGFFKGERPQLKEWVTSGGHISKAGTLGSVVALIEEDIRIKSPDVDWESKKRTIDSLDRAIAKVLAGNTLKFTQGYVTIMDKRYDSYRQSDKIAAQGDLSPGIKDEDPDYFTQITDNVLMGEAPVKELMQGNGRGSFTNEIKLSSWLGGVVHLNRDLNEKGLGEQAKNFRREMGEKITVAITQGVLSDSRTNGVGNFVLKGYGLREPAMLTLLKEGFLDVGPFLYGRITGSLDGSKMWGNSVLQALNPQLFNELESLAAKKTTIDSPEYEAMVNKWYAFMKQKHKVDTRAWSGAYGIMDKPKPVLDIPR